MREVCGQFLWALCNYMYVNLPVLVCLIESEEIDCVYVRTQHLQLRKLTPPFIFCKYGNTHSITAVHFIKMLKDVGMVVPKIKETRL